MDNRLSRLQAKTPQQHFLRVLEQEFEFSPREARAILEEAEACLGGIPGQLRPGQMRVLLTRSNAGHGRALRETPTQEVIWTVDAGAADRQVLMKHGSVQMRRVRIQRLLSEALEQGALATQEDLAQALQVSLRTIKRDCAVLANVGIYLPTRGNLHGIGRGQTHKAQIVGRWLGGETYDQLALHTHHSASSIRRYVQTFVRVVDLHRQGFADGEVALLLQIGLPLVQDYQVVYRQQDTPACRQRLEEQLQRLLGSAGPTQNPEKGAR
jgi:hypothetical protein